MDQYGDDDYDLDSSMAASKGAPSPPKQASRPAAAGMSDLERMKNAMQISDGGSELEESDEEEYGDKDDFDMTPEAVDAVPLYSEPKKTQNMQHFQPTVVKPQSVAPVQKEILVTPKPEKKTPPARVAAPASKVSEPSRAAPTAAQKSVPAKAAAPTSVAMKSTGSTAGARGASSNKVAASKAKASVTKTNTSARNAYEGGSATGKGRPGSAKPKGPATNLEAQRVTAEKLRESGKKAKVVGRQLGGEIAKPAKTGQGSLFNQSAISQKELSPNKQVRFDDDQELPSAVHKKKGGQSANTSIKFGVKQENIDGYSKSGQAIGLKLKSTEAQIEQHYTSGNLQERDNLLNQYTHQANEGAQLLTAQGPEDQSTALKILKRCHSLLKRHQTRQSPFTELTYETLNNIARCYNILGNIKESLEYLLLAYEHVQILAKVSEPGSVTIIPELGLNICNALNYIGNYQQALLYSSQVVESSEQCLQQLERKLDAPIGKISESQDSSWQGKLSQLYLSQFNLHIQGYQAKAKAYENLNSYQDAIREYSAAKTIVEKHFGTNHKLFKELVNQASSANLVLKNKTYSSKEDNQSLLFSGSGGKAEKSKGIMTQKRPQTAKAHSPEREVIQTHGDMIDIRSQDNDNESFFERGSIISKKSIRTEQDKSRSNNMKVQRHRRLVASAKQRVGPSRSGSRDRGSRSGRGMFRTNSSAMVRQPPMMAGGQLGGHNRYSNLSNLFRKDEQWKLDHYFAPNMHGKLGYPSFNMQRPKSFYFTSVKLANGTKTKKVAKPEGISREEREMKAELKRMRAMLNQKDEAFDEKMRQYMFQLENQRTQWESQSARTADQTIEHVPQQQQMVVPPIHPEFGPALFDYDRHQWVYPYADRQVKQEVKEEPRKLTHEMSVQAVYQEPKVETHTFETQTTLRQKELAEMAIQTQPPVQAIEMGTSPIKIPEKVREPLPVLIQGMTPEQAAVIIARHWRQVVLKRREAHYNMSDKGVLYTRKRKYNKLSGAMEIMSMYMVHDTENRCLALRFTVFNYATKDFIYFGVYDKLEYINEFDVYVLLDLSKKSLDLIGFEKSPFKMHILCMQSIINTYRINEKNQSKIELVEVRKEKKYEKLIKETPIIYTDPAPKHTKDMATQMEPIPDNETYLIPDKLPNRTLEIIIKIQRRVRNLFLPWARRNKRQLHLTGRQLLYHFRKKVESTEDEGYYQYFNVQLFKILGESNTRTAGGEEVSNYYTLCANNTKKSRDIDYWVTPYKNIRLPEDPTILRYFMEQAVIIKVDPITFKIKHLSLHRMKIKLYNEFSMHAAQYRQGKVTPIDKMGDNLRIEFDLPQYPGCVCSVWRRLRWANHHQTRVVKDWKIKVDQHRGAMDSDYLVVKRLPCAVKDIRLKLEEHLRVQFNKRIVPKTILNIFWNVKNITVYSQRYYDLNSPRYETFHHNTFYMSQNAETGNRFHTWDEIQEKHWHQFYEVYIQKLIPQEPQEGILENLVYDYQVKPQYQKQMWDRRRHLRLAKKKREAADDEDESEDEVVDWNDGASDADSDGSNMRPENYEQDAMYWDEEELEYMQLDDYTAKRKYFKVTCTQVVDKQDQDYFIIEQSIAKWPDPKVEFQYIMENIVLKQVIKPVTGEVKISICGLMIRESEHRFASEENWVAYLRSHRQPEVFMVQDVQRWRNQAINCTVYNARARDDCYIIEAVHVDRPYERAYMTYPTLKGMRGQILRFYVDSMLKVFSEQDVFNKRQPQQH